MPHHDTALYSWIMVNPCKAKRLWCWQRDLVSMLSTEYKPINSVWSCSLESTYRKLIVNQGERKVVNSGGLNSQQENFYMVKNLWRTLKMMGALAPSPLSSAYVANCSLFERSVHSSAMMLNNPPSWMFWPMSWRTLCAISLRMVSWISWAVYLLDFLLNHLSTTASALCKYNSWIKLLSVSTFLPLKVTLDNLR